MKALLRSLLTLSLLFSTINPLAAEEPVIDDFSTDIVEDDEVFIDAPAVLPPEEDAEDYGLLAINNGGIFYDSSSRGGLNRATYPATYDSRTYGYISPIKDQKSYGTCWAFSATAAMEASIKKLIGSATTVSLSDLQMVYFAYNKRPVEPLGNTAGNKTKVGTANGYSGNYLMSGGTIYTPMLVMANYVGMKYETAFNSLSGYSYNTLVSQGMKIALANTNINNNLAYIGDFRLKAAYVIPTKGGDSIKEAIMTYGAVNVDFYYSPSYFNTGSAGYYYPYAANPNHAVTIVGWDDNFSRYSFNKTPSKNGAWIVKNSWGTGWYGSKSGYFYLSYDYPTWDRDDSVGVAYVMTTTNYTNIFQYDTGMLGLPKISTNSQALTQGVGNIYTAPSNYNQILKEVGFFTADKNLNYSIEIYKDIPLGGSPNSGTKVAAATTTGSLSEQGYHTIQLANNVEIKRGTRFSVVIKFTSTTTKEPTIIVDTSMSAGIITYTLALQANRSYYYKPESNGWIDLVAKNGVARIKVFADVNTNIALESISLDKSSLSLDKGNSQKLIASPFPSDATNKTISWSSDNNAVATVSSDGVVYAVNSGTTVVRARNTLSGLEATCNVQVIFYPVTSISLPSSDFSFIGYKKKLSLTILPANASNKNISWVSSDTTVATVDTGGVVTPIKLGTATITATANDTTNGIKTASCLLSVETPVMATDFDISEKTLTIPVLGSKQIEPVLTPVKSIGNIKYKSSNTKVVTVDNNGLIWALAKGSAKITATLGSKQIVINVTVTAPTVDNFTVTSPTYNSAILKFDALAQADSYKIYVSTNKTKNYKLLTTIASGQLRQYLHANLKTGTTYYYKIRAANVINGKTYYGAFSPVISVKPSLTAPLAFTSPGVSNVWVTALPVLGASGYQYAYATSIDGKYKTVASTANRNFIIKKLAGNKNYYVKVRAYRKVGKSTVYGPYSLVSQAFVQYADPSLKSGNMYVGAGKKKAKVKAGWIYNKWFWAQYTIKNTGNFDLVLYNAVGFGTTHPNSAMYLANGKGSKKSSITIKPGKSVTVRFACKPGDWFTNISGGTTFWVKGKYDGKYYWMLISNYGSGFTDINSAALVEDNEPEIIKIMQ